MPERFRLGSAVALLVLFAAPPAVAASQPGAIAELAVGRHGAAGIVSWAQNQKSAWWGMDETLVRWGHLDTFGGPDTVANDQTYTYAATGTADYPLTDPEGGREPLRARIAPFSMGSDHQVWTEGSFRVPAIYLNDWPDRYIHTHADRVENLDPTKLPSTPTRCSAGSTAATSWDRCTKRSPPPTGRCRSSW